MARMTSEYKNTTGHCLEFFYILQGVKSGGKLRLSVRGTDYLRRPVLTIRKETLLWKRKFIHLPNGINQIIIDGKMKKGTIQSAAIDDISMAPCKDFGKSYLVFVSGKGFLCNRKSVLVF